MLEILDIFAGISSYNHCFNMYDEVTILTACIDNMNFYKQINIFEDL